MPRTALDQVEKGGIYLSSSVKRRMALKQVTTAATAKQVGLTEKVFKTKVNSANMNLFTFEQLTNIFTYLNFSNKEILEAFGREE